MTWNRLSVSESEIYFEVKSIYPMLINCHHVLLLNNWGLVTGTTKTSFSCYSRSNQFDLELYFILFQGLFSATQTKETEDLMRAGLRNPVKVIVKDETVSQVSNIT